MNQTTRTMEEQEKVIRDYFLRTNHTIGVAESVTAGCLQLALSGIPDAAQFFQGGITAYNSGQKARHLDIDPIRALRTDGVSEQIAVEMGSAACRMFCASVGIGVTGYATPGDHISDPFAFYAIVSDQTIWRSGMLYADSKNYGVPVQQHYAAEICALLAAVLVDK